jgi:putative phosphoribosyl transferase
MYRDRVDAGQQLAKELVHYANREDVLILGIPRGGVPVAFEVAQALRAPLDIVLVRKLGTPGQEELAMGAIASGGIRILNQQLVAELGITDEQVADAIATQEAELQRRERLYRGSHPSISVKGKIVILVDDGIATGSSVLAAVDALRKLEPKKIVVAVPVAPSHADEQIKRVADEFVCVHKPEWFFGIGQFYENFSQTEDSEVHALLEGAAEALVAAGKSGKTSTA